MGQWLALPALCAAWPLRGNDRRRRLDEEFHAFVEEHRGNLTRQPGYHGLRKIEDMSYLEITRRLFTEEGSACLLSGGGAVPYFNSCTGCALSDALQCVADMRENISLNVPVGCDLGIVGSMPDRGTAYSEPFIEDVFGEVWPHGRYDPTPEFPGNQDEITVTKYPKVPKDDPSGYRLKTPGEYTDATAAREVTELLLAEKARERDNKRCCAVKKRYETYAYPDALRCLVTTGCANTKIHEELAAECAMTCPTADDMSKIFRNPTDNAQPGTPAQVAAGQANYELGVYGGQYLVWEDACKAAMITAGSAVAPSLGLLALVAARVVAAA